MARAATLQGRIGLQPEWLSATSERICSGRLSPGCTGTDQEADLSQRGAQDAAAQGGASFEAAGSLAEVSQGRAAPEAAAVGAQAGMSRQPACCRGWLLDLPDLRRLLRRFRCRPVKSLKQKDMPKGTCRLCTFLLACHFTCICCNAYDGEACTGQDLDWLSAWQIHA